MLVESSSLKGLMDTTPTLHREDQQELQRMSSSTAGYPVADPMVEYKIAYDFSSNPVPGIVLMITGLMMSRHEENDAAGAAMHTYWGLLFVGFALARAVTYITIFLKPPSSHFPSRPPSELVAAYCLSFGGLLLMASTSDVVAGIVSIGLDTITVFTAVAGIAGIVLAWEMVCFAIKGWATRAESVSGFGSVRRWD
jgi:hypothetical protein